MAGARGWLRTLYVTEMSIDAFGQAVKAVKDAGLVIKEQVYQEKAFGSWYVVIATTPSLRLVWDGKEGWYVVEEETGEKFNGFQQWKELWIEQDPNPQSIQIGVNKLCAASNRST